MLSDIRFLVPSVLRCPVWFIILATICGCGDHAAKMPLQFLDNMYVRDLKPGECAYANTTALLVSPDTSIYLNYEKSIYSSPPTETRCLDQGKSKKTIVDSFIKIYRAQDGKYYVVAYGPYTYKTASHSSTMAVEAFAHGEVADAEKDDLAIMFPQKITAGFGPAVQVQKSGSVPVAVVKE